MKGLVVFLAIVAAAAASGPPPGGPAGPAGGIGRGGGMNFEVHDPRDRVDIHRGDDGDMHVNIEMGPPPYGGPNKDVNRGNPYPGAAGMNISHVYGVCHMEQVTPGPHGSAVSGTVYMRQPWLGCADVDVFYDLTGLPHMDHGGEPGEHSFKIHKYGDLSNNCANVGAQFWIDDDKINKHKGHGDHNPCHGPDICCNYAHSIRDVEGGDLGSFPCDDSGSLQRVAKHNQFTIMGFHTVVGRSLVVSHMGQVMGCCTIGTSNGDGFPVHVMTAFSQQNQDEPDHHNNHNHP